MLAQLTCDPVVALTFNDISHGVGTHRVAPPPSTLDATPVLGGFRFWPAWCTTGRSVCPSAALALCSTSPLMEDGRRCHQARASLPEVLFPFDARMGSSVCAMVPRPSRNPRFSRHGCRHVTGSLGPPRASCSTCRACFIPVASMGFSLQRSVHVTSRTPLGSPCPSFPWPRGAPFGFPSAGCRVSVTIVSRRVRRMCGAALLAAGLDRGPSTTRFRDVRHRSEDRR
jgi:hypothetical protein